MVTDSGDQCPQRGHPVGSAVIEGLCDLASEPRLLPH